MYSPVSDLSYFRTLVEDPKRIPMLEAAAALAQDEYPGLDLQQVLSSVDTLGQGLIERCRGVTSEVKRLQITLTYFYRELGFEGNNNNYYDPNNSFVHKVIETRRGIPITLSLLFIELAGLVQLRAQGISFPGHFLVKVKQHVGPVVLDPFSGRSLSQKDVLQRLGSFRHQLGLDPNSDVPIGYFLQPASPRDILLRMLRNLREIYRQQGQADKLKQVLERTLILDPEDEAGERLLGRLRD